MQKRNKDYDIGDMKQQGGWDRACASGSTRSYTTRTQHADNRTVQISSPDVD